MSDKEKPFPSKITDLDLQAKELGIGGNMSPETDERLYKKRMQKRKDIQSKRLKERNTKKGLLIVFTGNGNCLLYTSPSPRDLSTSRMPSSA